MLGGVCGEEFGVSCVVCDLVLYGVKSVMRCSVVCGVECGGIL